jgi:hypothetical protein
MPGNSSWMPYAPQGVTGLDGDICVCIYVYIVHMYTKELFSATDRNLAVIKGGSFLPTCSRIGGCELGCPRVICRLSGDFGIGGGNYKDFHH